MRIPARIASEHRGGYEIWSTFGEGYAQLAGRIAQGVDGEAFPGVGDWITLKSPPLPNETSIIDKVLARRTVFIRGAAGREARAQVVAANVDLVFVVTGLDADYSVRRIERYLALVWASGAQPVVVLNKVDLCDDADARVGEVEAASLEPVRGLLGEGLTAAFVGSSGAGKSTLINSLVGEARMPTREVRSRDGRGCHTTTRRQLVLLPQGGLVIDTPGMRELQLADEEGLDTVFADIEELAARCRFGDCMHRSEPGCAVREAVADGDLPHERLEHYLKLVAEARAYEIRHDERRRREADRAFGKRIARDGALIRRWKEGK